MGVYVAKQVSPKILGSIVDKETSFFLDPSYM
jgi:hypothetical protein